MLLIHNDPDLIAALSEAEKAELFGSVDRLMAELSASGEWVDGQGLVDARQGKTVRVRGGRTEVVDGPYIEMKEQFAGFLLVDVASEERAIEIAAAWPDASYAAMEVRAVPEPAT
jgi:hypothetical protein